MTKIVFCWPDISGYMAACWKTLHQRAGIEVCVIAFEPRAETGFSNQLMQGIPNILLDAQDRHNFALVKQAVLAQQPDVVYLGGWWHKPYRQLAFAAELKNTPLLMGMDTPWRGTLRQFVGTWLLRPYLNRIHRIIVTGERSWQYARRLGKSSAHIMRGYCGVDYDAWAPLWQQRQQAGWPRAFLFAGSYAPVKAIDVLVEGYQRYRGLAATEPWPLMCCGRGPLETYFEGVMGIDNRGFVQPQNMHAVWLQAGAFVLASRSDSWPLVLVEAAAAGLPIVCTDVCGSSVEVVRPLYNGLIIPPEDPEALAQALLHIHHRYDDLPAWGARAQQLAAPFSAEFWADRWQALLTELTTEKHSTGPEITSTEACNDREPL